MYLKLTALTTFNILDSDIADTEIIRLTGLQHLKRMTITNCENDNYLQLNDLKALEAFKYTRQRKMPNLKQLYVLPKLKLITILEMRGDINDTDIQLLTIMHQVEHFTFSKYSSFDIYKWRRQFEEGNRTVSYVDEDD